MPSRSPRSRSRSPTSHRHKKSHKRSKKSSDRDLSPSPSSSPKEDANGQSTKPRLPHVASAPSVLNKLDSKDIDTPSTPTEESSAADSSSANNGATKKRKKRFGDEADRVFIPHMPGNITNNNMSDEEQKIYLLRFQIENLTRRLKLSDYGVSNNPLERSPSPEPIYDQQGKRQNTREVRARRKIEDERHQLITKLIAVNPEYKPPGDYKPQQAKFTDKVMIPQEDYTEVNFVGLIIGPRGSTLKNLEKDTGAKIIIRGKGSVKDGKMGLMKYGPMPGEDEPLHAYISGSSAEAVAKAVEKVNEIINRAIDEPEGMNELRKEQLRELALLKGTFRENDCLIKLKLMHEAEKVVTNTIICTICGGAGHVTSDCKFRRNPDGTFADLNADGSLMNTHINRAEQQKLDCEYQSLMNELTGKKEGNPSGLSFEDQRSLMSGARTTGPTLAIGGGSPSMYNNPPPPLPNPLHNQPKPMMHYGQPPLPPSLPPPLPPPPPPPLAQQNSSSPWSNNGPRYNNNDVFDGHYLLRRHQRNPNHYSSYIEGDSYRARHIPALMEGNNSGNTNNYSNSWSNQNQSWNQYNSSNYYPQQYYPSQQQTGFVPPLPKTAPPPPPPPPPR